MAMVEAELRLWTQQATREASEVAAQLEHALRLDSRVGEAASRLSEVREQLEQTLLAQEKALEVCDEIGREQEMLLRQLEKLVGGGEESGGEKEPSGRVQERMRLVQRAAELDGRLRQMKDLLAEVQVGLDSMLESQSAEAVCAAVTSSDLDKNDDLLDEVGVHVQRKKTSEGW